MLNCHGEEAGDRKEEGREGGMITMASADSLIQLTDTSTLNRHCAMSTRLVQHLVLVLLKSRYIEKGGLSDRKNNSRDKSRTGCKRNTLNKVRCGSNYFLPLRVLVVKCSVKPKIRKACSRINQDCALLKIRACLARHTKSTHTSHRQLISYLNRCYLKRSRLT